MAKEKKEENESVVKLRKELNGLCEIGKRQGMLEAIKIISNEAKYDETYTLEELALMKHLMHTLRDKVEEMEYVK